jgi:3-oxoadipate enol-lactonase
MPYLDLGDASLFYEVSGPGKAPVVLVHGAMCSHVDWSHQLTDLSDSFTVVTPDLRGHGASRAPFESCTIGQFASDIHALIDELGFGSVVLVGHSLGARIVVEATAQRPDHVAGLVLVDGSRMFGPAPLDAADQASRLSDQQVLAHMYRTIDEAIGPFADAATRAHVSTTMRSAPIGLMRALLTAWQDWDVNCYDRALAAVPPRLPVLAIQSTHVERSVRRRCLSAQTRTTPYLEYLSRHLPSIGTVIVPDAGHFSMLEAPREVSRLIRLVAGSAGRSSEDRPRTP